MSRTFRLGFETNGAHRSARTRATLLQPLCTQAAAWRDAAILKAQHWLQNHASEMPSVKVMAELSGLEERTFLRRFQKATGVKPTEYCQRLRVGKALEMLEIT